MPVLAPLSTAICAQEKGLRELGPALVIASPHCAPTNTPDIWFEALDQRDDLTLAINTQFTDIATQASAIPRKLAQGTSLTLNLSLGRAAAKPEAIALMFDSAVVTDATTPTTKSVQITDAPGKVPTYYQVAIIPYDGNELDFSFGYVMFYAMAMADQTSFLFSPSNPRNTQFSFYGEKHPVLKSRGVYYKSTDGSDVQQLVDIAAQYTLANP